eukprot:1778-Heterococcus_DN1.PRE.2
MIGHEGGAKQLRSIGSALSLAAARFVHFLYAIALLGEGLSGLCTGLFWFFTYNINPKCAVVVCPRER